MRILIVNDDGIDSVGIIVLAEVFCRDNDIMVVAPQNQRSAFSHSITIHEDITFRRVQRDYPAYAISGTPADCTKTGVLYFNDGKPFDLVLSGINNGSNLGSDILYSGTVAAATEGAAHGIPSIAISLEKWECPESDYRAAAEFLHDNVGKFLSLLPSPENVLNINYPVVHPFRGVRLTKSGINLYDDCFVAGATAHSLRISGQPVSHAKNQADCDVELIKRGFVTVTPLAIERDDEAALKRMKGKKIFD